MVCLYVATKLSSKLAESPARALVTHNPTHRNHRLSSPYGMSHPPHTTRARQARTA